MAITEQELLQLLQDAELHYQLHERTKEPVLLFETYNYLNPNKQSLLMVVIQLSENGEYIKFFAPSAYYIENDESSYAVLRTLSIISWRVKMVDFELDGTDGEVRPTIDFPLEDNKLSIGQVKRCCQSIAKIIDVMDPFIQYAIIEGAVHEDLLHVDIAKLMLHHLALGYTNKQPDKEDAEEEDTDINDIKSTLVQRLREIQNEQLPQSEDSMEEPSSEDSDSNEPDDWI